MLNETIRERKKMGGEWWNEEIRELIQKKREENERILKNEFGDAKEEYRRTIRTNYPMKQGIKMQKRVKAEWGRKISDNFMENMAFWSSIKEGKR